MALQILSESERLKNSLFEYRTLAVYGGTEISTQIRALQKGIEIVVGTPGRILDLLTRGKLILEEVEVLVLDEIDQMLDKGFQEDMESILKFMRSQRKESLLQTLLFSATLPHWVKNYTQNYLKQGFFSCDLVNAKSSKTPH